MAVGAVIAVIFHVTAITAPPRPAPADGRTPTNFAPPQQSRRSRRCFHAGRQRDCRFYLAEIPAVILRNSVGK